MSKEIKKVAFVYLNPSSGEYYISKDASISIQRRPQLGFQYFCAILEKEGIETDIFDQTVSFFNLEWLIEELKGYDMVGFYCSDPQEDKVKTYSKRIKEELGIPILVGGPSTLSNSSFLDYGCDIVVHGEGEITIQEIIEFYNGKRKLKNIKGISYRKNGKTIKTPPRELIKNLDELPFPDRSKVDINAYYDYYLFTQKNPYITMIASRGCIHRCSFCTSCRIWKYRYRQRSVDNVITEIEEVVEKYGVRYIAFQDDIFGITNDWIEEFCIKLIKKPFKIRWMAILHPFSIRNDTERVLKLMKRAGCDTLSFGLQSAHPKILKNIRRHPSEPNQLKKTLKIANNLGFVTSVGYIFGLPGDTKKTIQTTIDYSLNCGSTLANFYILSVLRDSEIDRVCKKNNKRICRLNRKETKRLGIYASKKFYTKPFTILKIVHFILKNPVWFVKIGLNAPSLLSRIGF